MRQDLKCPKCNLKLEGDSKFCRSCGQSIKNVPDTEESELLVRSSRFVDDLNDSIAACSDYLERYPDGDAIFDIELTGFLCIAYSSYITIYKAFKSEDYSEVWKNTTYGLSLERARHYKQGVPTVLKNGLITQARLSNSAKLSTVKSLLGLTSKVEYNALLSLFDEANKEVEELLIESNTRAHVEQLSREEIYDEAETYYEMYREGNLNEAGKGFQYLKDISPHDPYFRSLNGAIFSKKGMRREAVREYLFGYYINPGEPLLAQNLMRELTTANLFKSAVDIWNHYLVYGQKGVKPYADEEINLLGNYSSMLLACLACARAKASTEDFDPKIKDFVKYLPLPNNPWLRRPEPISNGLSVLNNKKIFISYRRADGSEAATQVHRQFKAAEFSTTVFLDQADMVGGEEFTNQIREAIETSDLFLLLIGEYWQGIEGTRRLQQTKDVVRREIVFALKQGKVILPILLNKAIMPSSSNLPEVLRPITSIHAERLRMEYFDADWDKVLARIADLVEAREAEINATMKLLQSLPKEEFSRWGAKAVNKFFHKYINTKSKNGEGVNSPINWYGVWECRGKGRNKYLFMRLVIENRDESIVTGIYEAQNELGKIYRKELRGEWAMAKDLDVDLILGLYINAVLEDGNRTIMTIPFHEKVGDVYIGLNEELGLQFASRNIEPRAKGF